MKIVIRTLSPRTDPSQHFRASGLALYGANFLCIFHHHNPVYRVNKYANLISVPKIRMPMNNRWIGTCILILLLPIKIPHLVPSSALDNMHGRY